ncbi:MAG TPA: integrase [Treponema sp.]|nr:integrase [Treponema sp.]
MLTSSVPELLLRYTQYLFFQEKAEATIKKYTHDIQALYASFCAQNIATITKEEIIAYKKKASQFYKPASLNSMLISLDRFFSWAGEPELRVKTVRIQKHPCFNHIFSKEEYEQLLCTAQKLGKQRIYLIMRLLASTGIRISELRYITAEALHDKMVVVLNKGKFREIFIPDLLCRELETYCMHRVIRSGIIFHGKTSDRLLDKAKIWRDLQTVAQTAGFKTGTVHAQNFRHFFAKEYIAKYQNIADLADILGHSSIETTRIYTRTTESEKKIKINALNL